MCSRGRPKRLTPVSVTVVESVLVHGETVSEGVTRLGGLLADTWDLLKCQACPNCLREKTSLTYTIGPRSTFLLNTMPVQGDGLRSAVLHDNL
jgi:hypothetical protein